MVCKKKPRKKGKGPDKPCLICGERRFTENAHFPKRKRPSEGGKDTIPLCPTHHRLLEHGRLSKNEFEKIWQGKYSGQFETIEQFIEWAYENCYPYSLTDLMRKFWLYDPNMQSDDNEGRQ